ncbi:MAG: cobaltochelatase subunit CobT, partial [Gammaproteobacteria bacterium]|nr:cobaltochelatase subunit CobT [Gammaproteobacteria bacterium]
SAGCVSLPELPAELTLGALAVARGEVDAVALRLRYCDETVYARYLPKQSGARFVFALLEQVRVEALGSRRMVGVQKNLSALQLSIYNARITDHSPEPALNEIDAVLRFARIRLGAPLPLELTRLDESRSRIDDEVRVLIEALALLVDEQADFALKSRTLIESLGLLEKGALSIDQDRATVSEQDSDTQHRTASENVSIAIEWDPLRGPRTRRARESALDSRSKERGKTSDDVPYHAYTSEFDTIVRPEDVCGAEELIALRRLLDEAVPARLYATTRLAHRLQRHLAAQQMRSWRFDLEEGILDAGRLSRIVADPFEPLAFKQEIESPFVDTVVTVLIDNSGSMRGQPIIMAAACAEILGKTLERCGVKSEILGFTTASWRGGRVREMWAADSRPENPGRLSELKHIIYKSADVPWRRARRNLGFMLKGELLKENIDGEALLWAHDRLLARPERRRILMVISDGAPVDDATLTANDERYLDRHLRLAIDWIERRSPVQLMAIGIGHDVTNYYQLAFTVSELDDLGETMVSQLTALFDATHTVSSRIDS